MATQGSPARWLERMRRTTGPDRFRQYTLYSLHFLSICELSLFASWLADAADRAGGAGTALLGVLVAAHIIFLGLMSRAALPHYLGGAPRPTRLLAAATVTTIAAAATVLTLFALDRMTPGHTGAAIIWLLMFYSGPVYLALPVRPAVAATTALTATTLAAVAALGFPGEQLLVVVLTSLLAGPFMGVVHRVSGWSVKVVDELVSARETQSRLAVAEERLRFGRDMHDVLGRNLSVIALKSELAVQLARRERPEAIDQMTEVQRIAQESQREIRAVIRGYRTADLHTELAGARSVLEAAGVDCRIEDTSTAELPPEVQSALGWVVREGTTNVLRHTNAKGCRIALTTAAGAAHIVMENDGAPLSASSSASSSASAAGAGLTGLRERLAVLGGTLTASPLHGDRFRLSAEIPATAS